MIRIAQLVLKNIGPYEHEIFDFSIEKGNPDIHIFIGPNGTGKTTILHALASTFDFNENDHKEHTLNNFYKKFHFFDEDKNKLAISYSHTILNNEQDKVVDKISSYGCKICGNIHQQFDKTVAHNSIVSKYGQSYDTSPNSRELIYYKNAIKNNDLKNKKFKFASFAYSGYRFIQTEKIEITENEKFNPLKYALEFVKNKNESEKDFKISNWIASCYSKSAIEQVNGNIEKAIKNRKSLDLLIHSINELTDNDYLISIETQPWRVIVKHGDRNLEFDVLPDGLRSILSWLGDLLMRLDAIPWENKEIPVTEQNIILFLDEIEVHLHPTWQYKILNLVKTLFPNAQIFISTHSPFILNSIDNAKIYVLDKNDCKAKKTSILMSQTGWSIAYVLNNILNAKNIFGYETTQDLEEFNKIDAEIADKNYKNEERFKKLIQKLINDGDEVISMISPKLFRLKKITGKDYFHGEN